LSKQELHKATNQAKNTKAMTSPNSKPPNNKTSLIMTGILIPVAAIVVTLIVPEVRCFLRLDTTQCPNPSERKDIELIVQTEDQKPLEGVEVIFKSQGAPETVLTDSNGYATMNIPSTTSVEVSLQKKGFEPLNYRIDLRKDPVVTRTYRLKARKVTEIQIPESRSPSISGETDIKEPDRNPQILLPPSNSNRPSSSPENIGELQGTRIFEDRLTTEKQKQCYHFNLSKSSNTSFYVDRVTEGAGISSKLAVDTNHNGVIDDGENINSMTTYGGGSIGSIHELLGADPYSFCVDVKGRNTDYRLQLVNNLSEMKQLTQSAPQSGSLSDTNVQDYYQFTLDRPQSVSLVVSQISEPIKMNLYVDSNTNGAADDSENDDSFTVYPDPSTVFPLSDGKFEKTLSAGAYFVVLKRTKGNTDYNFALSVLSAN
jgi:hypothetical protein